MPPAVFASPKHACANYPICSKAQSRAQNGSIRERSEFCTSCLRHGRRCEHPSCDAPAAPAFGKNVVPSFCSLHYRDPCHTVNRNWNICKNSTIGCRLLAMKRTSGPCYPCSSGSLPCLHAQWGCPAHVRSSPSKNISQRAPCVSHKKTLCRFDPCNKATCS